MSRLTDAISWSGVGVTLCLFVLFPGKGGADFVGPQDHVPEGGTKTYCLVPPDARLNGRECYEYDLKFDGVPGDLESIVIAWLEATVRAGADVAWFAFEGSFHFDHILTEDVARQVFAIGSERGVELAIDDETRLSAGWAAQLLALKELAGLSF